MTKKISFHILILCFAFNLETVKSQDNYVKKQVDIQPQTYQDHLQQTVLKKVNFIHFYDPTKVYWLNESGNYCIFDFKQNKLITQSELNVFVSHTAQNIKSKTQNVVASNKGLITFNIVNDALYSEFSEISMDYTTIRGFTESKHYFAVYQQEQLSLFSKQGNRKLWSFSGDMGENVSMQFYDNDTKLMVLNQNSGILYSLDISQYDIVKKILPKEKHIVNFEVKDDILVIQKENKLFKYSLKGDIQAESQEFSEGISTFKIIPSKKGILVCGYDDNIDIWQFDKKVPQRVSEVNCKLPEKKGSAKIKMDNDSTSYFIQKGSNKIYYYNTTKCKIDSFTTSNGQIILNQNTNQKNGIALVDKNYHLFYYELQNDSFKLINHIQDGSSSTYRIPEDSQKNNLPNVCFSSDENEIYFVDIDWSAGVDAWEYKNFGKKPRGITSSEGGHQVISLSKDILISTSDYGLRPDSMHTNEVLNFRILSGSWHKQVEAKYKKLVQKIKIYEAYEHKSHAAIIGLDLIKSKDIVLIARKTGFIEVYDLINAKVVKTYDRQTNLIEAKFLDDNTIIFIEKDSLLVKMDIWSGAVKYTHNLDFKPKGFVILKNKNMVVYKDNLIQILNGETYAPERILVNMGRVDKMKVLNNDFIWLDGVEYKRKTINPIKTMHLAPESRYVSYIDFYNDSNTFCAGYTDGSISIFRIEER